MKKIYINSEDFDTTIAVEEDGKLVNLFTERKVFARAGNIFKGKIQKTVKNMNFVFVDIGDDKPGFLSEEDYFDSEGAEYIRTENGSEGNEPAGLPKEFEKGRELMVQVQKEPYATKGARLTTEISIPGYYVVYSPYSKGIGISRKISDEKERSRLKHIISTAKKTYADSFGIIVRTQAVSAGAGELVSEIARLHEEWQQVKKNYKKGRTGSLLYKEQEAAITVLREFADSAVEAVITDSEEIFSLAKGYMTENNRDASRLKLYEGPDPLFEYYALERQVEGVYNSIVSVKKGGYIKTDITEALTVIDINSGKFKGSENAEESITAANIAAAKEIARQIILRNIGGLIVVDFIDMHREENRKAVRRVMDEELKKSKLYFKTAPISEFGLMEISRKRMSQRPDDLYFEPCGCCGGRGRVFTTENNCIRALKKIKYECKKSREKNVAVMFTEEVKKELSKTYKKKISDMEKKYKKKIVLKSGAKGASA